jgi:RecA/RadA recombinase
MATKKLSLTERLMKNTTIKETAIFTESKVLERAAPAVTGIPLLNVALSGEVTGGLTSGLGVIAGPSKHFKTGLVLQMIKAYMDANEDAVCLFYDNEFGSPQGYFDAAGIDTKRVIHTPIMNIEDLKFDVIAQLEEVKKGDKLIIVIDSIGNLASKKEVEDAKDQKAVADMTRAKQLKSLFRMVTPYLTMADIPMIAINHTYKTQEMYAKDVVSGGTGIYYSANWIFIMGRQQETEGSGAKKELMGFNFIIKNDKSRFVREGSKIPLYVDFEEGIQKWSGMLELAVEMGYVTKPKEGQYARAHIQVGDELDLNERGKPWKAKETMCDEFWEPVFRETDFASAIKRKFKLGIGEANPSEAEEVTNVEEE